MYDAIQIKRKTSVYFPELLTSFSLKVTPLLSSGTCSVSRFTTG